MLSPSQKTQVFTVVNLEGMLIGLEYRDPASAASHLQDIESKSGFKADLTGEKLFRFHRPHASPQWLLVS